MMLYTFYSTYTAHFSMSILRKGLYNSDATSHTDLVNVNWILLPISMYILRYKLRNTRKIYQRLQRKKDCVSTPTVEIRQPYYSENSGNKVLKCRCLLNAVRKNESQNTVQPVWRRALGWTAGVIFLVGTRDFSLHKNVQTGYEVHLASWERFTRGWSRQNEKLTTSV
jgi:hypothetical protein